MNSDNGRSRNRKKADRDPLALRHLVAEASASDLRRFLRAETKRNKSLSIRLKALLIESISTTEVNKYEALLGEIIKQDVNGITVLSKREVALLREVGTSFLEHAATLYDKKEYREVFTLLFAMIGNLHRYLDRSGDRPDLLEDLIVKTYERLQELVSADLAPELRDDITRAGLDLLSKSYHTLVSRSLNMISILSMTIDTPETTSALHDTVMQKLTSQDDVVPWLYWYVKVASSADRPLDEVLLSQLTEGREVFRIAKMLDETGANGALRLWIASNLPEAQLNQDQLVQWNKWKFKGLPQVRQSEHFELGLDLLIKTGDLSFYDQLLAITDSETIASRLKEARQEDLAVQVLIRGGNWQTLEQLIVGSGRLDLVTAHMREIVQNIRKYPELLASLIGDFLVHNAGTNCSDQLSAFFDALENHRETDLAESLRHEIREAFPGRFVFTAEGVDISY